MTKEQLVVQSPMLRLERLAPAAMKSLPAANGQGGLLQFGNATWETAETRGIWSEATGAGEVLCTQLPNEFVSQNFLPSATTKNAFFIDKQWLIVNGTAQSQ